MRLKVELDKTAGVSAAKDRRANGQLRPRGWSSEDLDNKDERKGDGWDVVSWIEVTSRVFQIKAQENVFVIPAWDMHPGAKAVRKLESQPLVQTVVRKTNSLQARVMVRERRDRREETQA